MSIKFYLKPESLESHDDFKVYVNKNIQTKEELLKALFLLLKLPDYFGFNWDALHECLRDFNWISEKKICIVHEDLPILDINDLKFYIVILYDSISDWKVGDEHILEVYFPIEFNHKIEKIIFEAKQEGLI